MKKLIPVSLIFLLFVLGCGGLRNITSRHSGNFDPYKGSLSELLKPEIGGSLLKFKLSGTRNTTAQFSGATEAVGFTYQQDGAGVVVPVDGALVNFSSAALAETELAKVAATMNASPSKKNKGQRFIANGGKFVGWTNGSLMCVVKSDFAKPAGNFEEVAPF